MAVFIPLTKYNTLQYREKLPTVRGDYLVSIFHPLTIVSNVFMGNGTYSLMVISRVYSSMKNRTYPLMFIGRVYNTLLSLVSIMSVIAIAVIILYTQLAGAVEYTDRITAEG